MQTQVKIQDDSHGLSPSFSCYSSDSLTSKAVDKVIREEQTRARFQEYFGGGEDFVFSLVLRDEEDMDLKAWAAGFPLFKLELLLKDEINHKDVKTKVDEIINGSTASITGSLRNLFIYDQKESSSSSSSEAELGIGKYTMCPCLWSPKADNIGSVAKCKKSSSTGSFGSKKWKIRYAMKRSNSEGKEPMVLLSPNNKKTDTSPKQKLHFSELSKGTGCRSKKVQTPVHELFYAQRRAEKEMGKRKSYLPYRKDLVGLFANVKGTGKMLPF